MQERGDTRSNKEDRQNFFEIDCKQEEIQDRMEKIEKKKFEIDCKQKKIEIEWRRSTKISWDRLQARGDTRSNEEDRQKFLEIECNNQEIQDRLQEIESQKLKNGRRSNRRKSTRKKGSRKKFVKRSNWNFCSFQRVSRDLPWIPNGGVLITHISDWSEAGGEGLADTLSSLVEMETSVSQEHCHYKDSKWRWTDWNRRSHK